MSSKRFDRAHACRLAVAGSLLAIGVAVATAPRADAQRLERADQGEGRRFYPDDPVWRDGDMRDIPPVAGVRPLEELRVRARDVRRDR